MTKDKVAIKLEPIKTQFPQLEYENKLYRLLRGGGKIKFQFNLTSLFHSN